MGVKAAEFAEFNGLLAAAAERGRPLEEALQDAREQLRSRAVRRAAEGAAGALREGHPLGDALRRFPDVFTPEYCALVEAGTAAGQLPRILRGVEQEHALRAQVAQRTRRVAVYLLVGLSVCAIVCGIISTVGSQFRRLFQQLRIDELPLPTEWVLSASESGWMSAGALLGFVVVSTALWYAARWLLGTSGLVYFVPLIGRLQKARDLATVCTVIALRLDARAPLPDALEDASRTVTNRRFRRILLRVREKVVNGGELSEALFYSRFFPRTLAWGVSLGESRADVPGVLATFGELYASQLGQAYEVLLMLLTPMAILALGNVVVVYILALFLPIIEIQRRLAG